MIPPARDDTERAGAPAGAPVKPVAPGYLLRARTWEWMAVNVAFWVAIATLFTVQVAARSGGVIELPGGTSVVADVTLRPGRYLAICSIRDPAGRRHFDLGVRAVVVVAPA